MVDPQTLPVHDVSSVCVCGCTDEGVPALDVRTVPHAIRPATVFGALGAISVGWSTAARAPQRETPRRAPITAPRTGRAPL